MINLKSEAQGFYTLRLGTLDADGTEVDCYEPVPTFPNLITNGGLERMGNSSGWMSRTYVGSGSATPNFNDSAMNNLVAITTIDQASAGGTQSTAPYYTWARITRRFAAGAAAGNLSEVGVGWSDGLFSRALIVDAGGNPTTITVGADQFLDVTYEFRFYPKATDDTGSFTLTGNLGGVYEYVYRSANIASNDRYSGWYVSTSGLMMSTISTKLARDGAIGAITESPSGAAAYPSFSVLAYEANSLTLKATMPFGLGTANFQAGIKSVLFKFGIGTFQVEFSPAIMKTSDTLLSLEFSHSWGRRA